MTTHIQKCYLCDSLDVVSTCARCNKPYCAQDTSKLDPKFCDDCMRDVEITEKVVSKTDSDWDEATDTISYDTHKSRLITFRGIDWMFAAKWISDLTDDELRPVLEYHRGFVHHLESEILERQIKKQRQVMPGGITPRKLKTVQTTKVVRKRVSKPIDLDALVDMAMKLGITDLKDIAKFLAKQNNTTEGETKDNVQ